MAAWWMVVVLAATTPRAVQEYRLEIRTGGEEWFSRSASAVIQDPSKLANLSDDDRRANGTEVFIVRDAQRIQIGPDATDHIDYAGVRAGDQLLFFPPLQQRTNGATWSQRGLPAMLDDVVYGQKVRITASWPRALGCRLLGPDGKLVTPSAGDVARVTLEFVHDHNASAAFSCAPSWRAVREKLVVAPQLPPALAKAISEHRSGTIAARVDEVRGAVEALKLEPNVLATTFVEALRVGGVEATLVNVSDDGAQLLEALPWLVSSPTPTVYVAGIGEWFEVDGAITPLCSDRLLNRVGVAMNGPKDVLRTGGGKTDCATFTSDATVSWSDNGAATWTERVSTTGPCRHPFFRTGIAARRREELGAYTVTSNEPGEFTLTDLPSLMAGTSRGEVPQPRLERVCDLTPLEERLKRPRGDQLELGSPRTVRSTVTLELPDGFDLDAAASLTGEAPGLEWSRSITRGERRVVVTRSVRVTRSLAPVKDQATLQRAWSAWASLPPLKLEDINVIAARRTGTTSVKDPSSSARVASWAGLPDLALAKAREATKKSPRSPLAWRALIEALRVDSLGRGTLLQNRDEQLRAIDVLLTLSPHDVEARQRWLELHDAPALVTAAAVRRVTGDAHFQEARTLRTAVAWWLLTNVNLEDVKWPPELVASAREAQRKHGTTLTDEQLRRLRRYEEVETPLKRHETMAFDATNAVHVASEVLAHRFGLRTRVPAAKVGVSSRLLPPRGALSDLGLDQLLAGDVEETACGVNERWVRFGRPTDPAFIVLLKKSADGSWRASPQQEAAASLTAIAKALDGDDEASLRDALRVLVAARAARMPNPASAPGPVVVKALLSALAEPPARPPSPAFRARVAMWLHFGDDVRREVAMLQHAWGWPDDARATAERLPADLQLRFDLARLRGDFALAETLVNDADALQASACDVALRLGKTACFTGARQAARAQLKGVERSNELNNLAWAAVFSDAELWPDALVDAREAAELDANFGSVGTRVVLEALVGAPADFAASVDAFWAARPPSTVDTQFLTFALAVQAERLGFTDEAMRLYAQVKPLVPQDALNDVTPLARARLAKLRK